MGPRNTIDSHRVASAYTFLFRGETIIQAKSFSCLSHYEYKIGSSVRLMQRYQSCRLVKHSKTFERLQFLLLEQQSFTCYHQSIYLEMKYFNCLICTFIFALCSFHDASCIPTPQASNTSPKLISDYGSAPAPTVPIGGPGDFVSVNKTSNVFNINGTTQYFAGPFQPD